MARSPRAAATLPEGLRRAALAVLLAGAACADRTRPGASDAEASSGAAAAGPASPLSDREACVDRALAARGLNRFGDPAEAMYPGGTPLFDERTGKREDRIEHVLSRRPDIASECGGRTPGRSTDR